MRSLAEIESLKTGSAATDWVGREARLEISGLAIGELMSFVPDPRIAIAFGVPGDPFSEAWAVQPPDPAANRLDSHLLVCGLPVGRSDAWVSVDGHRYLVPLPKHQEAGQDGQHHRWSITPEQRSFARLIAEVFGLGGVEDALAKCGIGVTGERDGDVFASYIGKRSEAGEGYEGPIELGWNRQT